MRLALRSSISILAVIAALASVAAQTKPNFSGEWTMVPEKSDFSVMQMPAKMTRTITHTDPNIKIVTVQSGGAMGDTTIETTFTTDGKPQKNSPGGSPMTTVGKWDGDSMVFNSTLSQQGGDITIEDRYTLSDAGKTLTVLRKFTTADGQSATIRVVLAKK